MPKTAPPKTKYLVATETIGSSTTRLTPEEIGTLLALVPYGELHKVTTAYESKHIFSTGKHKKQHNHTLLSLIEHITLHQT
jgi:hypothetical protein